MNNKTKCSLVVDIGNSSFKWSILDANRLSDMQIYRYPDNINHEYFINIWQGLSAPESIVVSCVAHDVILFALEQACDELWNVKVKKVDSLENNFELLNAYTHKETLGSDRCCAMLGGLQITESAFMLVDAGSAMTIDAVNREGQHLGGYIVPGMTMMKKSLGLRTAKVINDSTNNILPSLSLSNSTEECVDAGICLSSVALIEKVYENEVKSLKGKCLLTGSNAVLIAELLSIECDIVPDLVLRGLAVVAISDVKNN